MSKNTFKKSPNRTTTSTSTTTAKKTTAPTTKRSPTTGPKTATKSKNPTTRITIKYDVGFSNTLFVRGTGPNLSWDKGTKLKNTQNDEWVWETKSKFTTCEFKVLINDHEFEGGGNHPISCGASLQYTPVFETT